MFGLAVLRVVADTVWVQNDFAALMKSSPNRGRRSPWESIGMQGVALRLIGRKFI